MKGKILFVLLILTIIVTGCSSKEIDVPPDNNVPIEPDVSSQDSMPDKIILASFTDTSQSDETTINKNNNLINLNIKGLKGKITHIFSGYDNNILVLADELYVYNVVNNAVTATTQVSTFQQVKVEKVKDGYALLGHCDNKNNISGDSISFETCDSDWTDEYTYILFDKNLKQIKRSTVMIDYTFDISDIDITPDGQSIICGDYRSIKKIDPISNQTSTLLNLKDKNLSNGLLGVQWLSVTNDSKNIVFTGRSFLNNSKYSVTSYGTMSTDRRNVKNKVSESYIIEGFAKTANNITVFPEDTRALTGRLLVYDVSTGKDKIFELSSKKECNGTVSLSEKGNYFATGELKNNEYIVRIYNTFNGSLIKTMPISDENESYFYRGSNIEIIEDCKTCIVSLGSWNNQIDTKIYSFGF